MSKKLIIAIVIIVIAIAGLAIYKHFNKELLTNNGVIGEATLQHITHEVGFGLNIDAGVLPLEINLTSGKLNIQIKDGNDVIFEETNITESKTENINISDDGYYIMMLSGNNATGTIKYPVAKSSNEPSVVKDVDEEEKELTESLLKTDEGLTVATLLSDNFIKDNQNVQEVTIEKLKIYTKEEIEKDDILKTYTIGEKDIVFDASYSITFKQATNDMMSYTAANGEIVGNKVINKYNCGIAKYDEETDSYTITNFGTAF